MRGGYAQSLERIWLNSGRDRGGWGVGGRGRGKGPGRGGSGKNKAEAGGRQRTKSFTVRAGVGGWVIWLLQSTVYLLGL